jgi:excisionase family DNA binding protein
MGRGSHDSPCGDQGTHAGKDMPLLSTVDETAALLRTTRKGIYSMIERGQLPGVTRIGRRVLIRTPDLLDWLGQKSTPSLER